MSKFIESPWIRDEALRLLDAQKESIHGLIRHATGRRLTDAEIAQSAEAFMAAVVDDVLTDPEWDEE